MLRRFSVNFAILSMVLDIALTMTAFHFAVFLRSSNILPIFATSTLPADHVQITIYVAVPVIWALIFLFMSVYDPQRTYRFTDELGIVFRSVGLSAMLLAGLLYLTERDLSRGLFLTFAAVDLAFILGWRVIARSIFRLKRFPILPKRNVLIIGAGQVGQRVSEMMSQSGTEHLNLVGFLDDDQTRFTARLPILGNLNAARLLVNKHKISNVIIALPLDASKRLSEVVHQLHDLPVHVRVVPDYFSLALYQARVDEFGGLPLINLRAPALNDVQRFVKRLFDIFIVGTGLLFIWPIMALIALAVKLDSKGPIFFIQKRVGENGELFGMYKFRSMVVDADKMQAEVNQVNENGDVIHKVQNDPRVTRMGRFIRRTSVDELPQLLNVLKGDMSLIGPRPEMPWLVESYEPWQHRRFAVPQGITGWWQVNGRSDKPMHLHTEEDLYYIKNYSLWLDLYILFKTPLAILQGKGAF